MKISDRLHPPSFPLAHPLRTLSTSGVSILIAIYEGNAGDHVQQPSCLPPLLPSSRARLPPSSVPKRPQNTLRSHKRRRRSFPTSKDHGNLNIGVLSAIERGREGERRTTHLPKSLPASPNTGRGGFDVG
jgi:hypothetical protein